MADDGTTGAAADIITNEANAGSGVRGTTSGTPIVAPSPAAPPAPAARPVGSAGMSQTALNERLRRAEETRDRKWAESLGCKTVEEAKALVERGRELEAAQKEAKLAELSETERLKTLLAERDAELAEERMRVSKATEETNRERETRMLEGVAGKYFKPKYVRAAFVEFREYLRTLTDEEVESMKPREVEKWFTAYAKENPELTLEAKAPGTETDATKAPARPVAAPARRPIATGAPVKVNPANRPANVTPGPTTFMVGGVLKDVRPGRSNSATTAEVAAHAAKNGIHYPGGNMRRATR